MGGVAGHAGLFSCARDIDRLATTLSESWLGQNVFLPSSIVSEFWRRDDPIGSSDLGARVGHAVAQGLDGRQRVSRGTRSATSASPARRSGSTSTVDLHVIVLSNRVHPTRDNDLIRDFRPQIHDLIVRAVAAS